MNTIMSFISGSTASGLMTWHAAVLDCGHKWYSKTEYYQPISSVKAGDTVECEECAHNAKAEQWLRDLDYSQVHHSRYDSRFGGTYRYYRLDPASPSNFMLIGATPATPAIDAILRTKTNCGPLSPTEQA